jgi:hypothetical protein
LSVLSQESPGVPGNSENFDNVGLSVGCGRLNADRFEDAVIGVPGESWRARPAHRLQLGRVVVMPGGADRVVTARSWAFSQESAGIPDRAETSDLFGDELLVDDVTGDGWDELIIWATEGGQPGARPGALFVLPGTRSGIRARGTTVIYGQTRGLPKLGPELVSGNFDRRAPRDVIVGSSRRPEGLDRVTLLHGTPSGLTAVRSRTISRVSPGMPPLFRSLELVFGGSLAAGDADGDGDDDLLVANIVETVDGVERAGRVFLIRGRQGGITTDGVQWFSQNTPGVPGRAHRMGLFGRCVELIDRDGDGRTEAVNASDERRGSAGAITILRATPSGLTGRGARRLDPADFGATSPDGGYGFGCDLAG